MTKFEEIAQGFFSPDANAEIDAFIVFDTGVAFPNDAAGVSQAATYEREMKGNKSGTKRIITREQVEAAANAEAKPAAEVKPAAEEGKDAPAEEKKSAAEEGKDEQ